jgi:hydrogenase maturation factor
MAKDQALELERKNGEFHDRAGMVIAEKTILTRIQATLRTDGKPGRTLVIRGSGGLDVRCVLSPEAAAALAEQLTVEPDPIE